MLVQGEDAGQREQVQRPEVGACLVCLSNG